MESIVASKYEPGELSEILKIPENVDTNFRKFMDLLKKRRDNEFDNFIAVLGDEGYGKSTFSIFTSANYDPAFTLSKNVLFDPPVKNLIKYMNTWPRGSAFDLDEAVDTVDIMQYRTSLGQMLMRHFTKVRERKGLLISNIPSLNDLLGILRNRRLQYAIEIVARGHAIIYERLKHKRTDRFGVTERERITNEYIKDYGTPETKDDELYLWRLFPGYMYETKFPKLPVKVMNEYRKLRDIAKEEQIAKDEEMTGMSGKIDHTALSEMYNFVSSIGLSTMDLSKINSYSATSIGEIRRLTERIKEDKRYNYSNDKILKFLINKGRGKD